MVVAVMAIVGIFATVLLSLSLMNYRMKHVNLQSQDNFYDAEKVLDDIRTGIAVNVVSPAAGEAYQNMLSLYSSLNADERSGKYVSLFYESMKGNSLFETDCSQWSSTVLQGYIKDEAKTSAKSVTVSAYNGLNTVEQEVTATGCSFTLKNVKVTYIDTQGYMTEIQTDLVISCPDLEFVQNTKKPELTSYCIVANNQTQISGLSTPGVVVAGNAYLGNKGVSVNNATVQFSSHAGSKYVVTAGEVSADNGSMLIFDSGIEVWEKQLTVDSSTVSSDSDLYLNDDLVLGNGSTVTLRGNVYAYGNPENIQSSAVYTYDLTVLNADSAISSKADIDANPANYSSAFLINGKNTKLDLSGITKLQIAGNAYVATKAKTTDNLNDIMMGESISLKANQRAYLVPAQYVAAGYSYGGMNPMTGDTYNNLCNEVAGKKGVSADDIKEHPEILIQNDKGELAGGLSEKGVTGVQTAYYRSGTINMVYLFLVFQDADAASDYAMNYFSDNTELTARVDATHYNTTITYASLLDKTKTALDYGFYCNGNILYANPGQENNDIPSEAYFLNKTSSSAMNVLKGSQNTYQAKYAALCHVLKSNFAELTSEEKMNTVFVNLVIDLNQEPWLSLSGSKEFTTAAGDKAVVVKGDYTLNDSNIHVVIASGNVTVCTEFNGLILAGGNVIINSSDVTPNVTALKITSSSDIVKEVMGATAGDGTRTCDYLIDGEQYLKQENSNPGTTGDTTVNFMDCVTYSNWRKQ